MAMGTRKAAGEGGPKPRAPVPSAPVRVRRPTSPFGAGFRRGLLVSVAVHAALLGIAAWRLLGGDAGAPPPGPLDTDFAVLWELEVDPEMAPPPPVDPPPPEEPTLLETVLAEPDPRLEEETPPPAGEHGTVGIGVEGSRPAPRRIGRTGRKQAAPTVPNLPDPPPPPEPPAPAPLFVAARADPAACTPPRYPRLEEERGIAGTVRLRVTVAADGSVSAVSVEATSGSEALDGAAAAAVARWTFQPATEDGVPVESVVLQPVTFRNRNR